MKKLSASLLIVFSLTALAQNYSSLTSEYFLDNITKRGSMKLKLSHTQGNPFVFPKWLKADIYLSSKPVKFTLDSVNYLGTKDWFIFKNNNELYRIFPENVKLIVLYDENQKRYFYSMPWNKGLNLPVFAEIFTDNPEQAYVFVQYKRIREPKNKSQSYASDRTLIEYVLRTNKQIYIQVNGDLISFNGGFGKLAKLLKSDKKTLKKWAKSQNLRIKNPADLQKLLEIFYSNEAK